MGDVAAHTAIRTSTDCASGTNAELTVDQYRDVLAMPSNVEKLRRNGRLCADRTPFSTPA